jgi:hypothetical protein
MSGDLRLLLGGEPLGHAGAKGRQQLDRGPARQAQLACEGEGGGEVELDAREAG